MKLILLTLSLHYALLASAHQDFRPGPENTPDEAVLRRNRECFLELERLGCTHPKDDQDFFIVCYRSTQRIVSAGCQELVNGLYGD